MKKIGLLLLAIISVGQIKAQDQTVQELKNASSKTIAKDPKDTTVKTWKKGGLFKANFWTNVPFQLGSRCSWPGAGSVSV